MRRLVDDDARDVDVLDDIARAYGTTRARVVDALLARCGFERYATTTTTTMMIRCFGLEMPRLDRRASGRTTD